MFNVGGLEFGMGFSSMLRNGVTCEALGVYASSLFVILSGSPLSTIRTVLRTKDSQTILGQMTAAQCVNTGLWTAYGLAVRDHFVWGPNIIVSLLFYYKIHIIFFLVFSLIFCDGSTHLF